MKIENAHICIKLPKVNSCKVNYIAWLFVLLCESIILVNESARSARTSTKYTQNARILITRVPSCTSTRTSCRLLHLPPSPPPLPSAGPENAKTRWFLSCMLLRASFLCFISFILPHTCRQAGSRLALNV